MTKDEYIRELQTVAALYEGEGPGDPGLVIAIDDAGNARGACYLQGATETEIWKMLAWVKRMEAGIRKGFLRDSAQDPDEALKALGG